MTTAQLAGLPTDPAALKAWLLKRFKAEGNLEPADYSLFWSDRHLVFDLPVPAEYGPPRTGCWPTSRA